MTKKTPPLYASGKWVLRTPWLAANDVTYVCHAIRTFEDIEKMGENVYERYYKPYITNGSTHNGVVWKFSDERLLYPNIVTLISNDNRIIYVPDTFITSFPDASEFTYRQVVLAVPLGILPDKFDVSHITAAIKDKVSSMLGITVTPLVSTASLTSNPTLEEHLSLEANRQAAIRNAESTETLLIQEKAKNASLQERNRLYESILRQNGLLS